MQTAASGFPGRPIFVFRRRRSWSLGQCWAPLQDPIQEPT